MFGLGMQELIIILVIIVVLFGASRLPQVGDGVGKMINNFRKSMKSVKDAAAKEDEDGDSPSKPEIPKA
jgi:sec-independent protein translocase protein TatA